MMVYHLVLIFTATILRCTGFSTAALEMLRRNLNTSPMYRRDLALRAAWIAESHERWDVVLEMLSVAGPPDGEAGFYYVELAHAHEKLGNYGMALEFYQKAFDHRDEFGKEFLGWLAERIHKVQMKIN